VPRPGSVLTAEQVRDWCAAALAAFKIPVAVRFRASLPYTETGKVMKHELEREVENPRASTDTPTARS
jgi:acyl-CoA synthetase (AMP-forming)/AMP-acid ligase II